MLATARKAGETVATTTISLFEVLYPTYHRQLGKEERVLRGFVRETTMLGLDAYAAEESARIMGRLLKIGTRVNTIDVMITGIAVANGADKIITSDKGFQTIQKVANISVAMI